MPYPFITRNKKYTYAKMIVDSELLKSEYPELINFEDIATTYNNHKIRVIKLGKGPQNLLLIAGTHAREYINANVLMAMIDDYAHNYTNDTTIPFTSIPTPIYLQGYPSIPTYMTNQIYYNYSYNVKKLLDNVTIHFIPMHNPDGICIQQGIDPVPSGIPIVVNPVDWYNGGGTIAMSSLSKYQGQQVKNITALNDYLTDCYEYSSWKSNARGVDVQYQYPTEWENKSTGQIAPCSEYYKGSAPATEIEAIALMDYLKSKKWELFISYHTQWQKIMWVDQGSTFNYNVITELKDNLVNMTGYHATGNLTDTDYGASPVNWARKELGIPSVIIESYPQEYPYRHYPDSKFADGYDRLKCTGLLFAKFVQDKSATDKKLAILESDSKKVLSINSIQKAVKLFNKEYALKEIYGRNSSGNLVYNGKGQMGTAGWTLIGGGTDSVADFVLSNSSTLNETVMQTKLSTSSDVMPLPSYLRQRMSVKPNTTYAFAIRAQVINTIAHIYIAGQSDLKGNTNTFTKDYQYNMVTNLNSNNVGTYEWYTGTFTTKPDEKSVYLNITNVGKSASGSTTNSYVNFTDITLVEGNTVPPYYIPSYKDTIQYSCTSVNRPKYLPVRGITIYDETLAKPIWFAGTPLTNSILWKDNTGSVV